MFVDHKMNLVERGYSCEMCHRMITKAFAGKPEKGEISVSYIVILSERAGTMFTLRGQNDVLSFSRSKLYGSVKSAAGSNLISHN